MRALAGPVMLLVAVGGFGLYRLTNKPDAPTRDFLELEFAGADDGKTGTCYSLNSVLIANSVFSNATREWKGAGDDRWTLALDEIQQGYGGPSHVFQRYTFEKRDEFVHLVAVEVSKGQSPAVNAHIDELLTIPNDIHSTPTERCQDPAVTGYLFKRKRVR
jgi:hypothetical protein